MKSLFSTASRASLAIVSVMTFAACTHSGSSSPSANTNGGAKPSSGTRAGDILSNGKCSPQVIADYFTANASCNNVDSFSEINKCQGAMQNFVQAHPNVSCSGVAADGTNYSFTTKSDNSSGPQASIPAAPDAPVPAANSNFCTSSFVAAYDRIQDECTSDDMQDMNLREVRACQRDAGLFWDNNSDVTCARPDGRSVISASTISDLSERAEFELEQRGQD